MYRLKVAGVTASGVTPIVPGPGTRQNPEWTGDASWLFRLCWRESE